MSLATPTQNLQTASKNMSREPSVTRHLKQASSMKDRDQNKWRKKELRGNSKSREEEEEKKKKFNYIILREVR